MTYEELLQSLEPEQAEKLEQLHAARPELGVRALMILLNKNPKRAPNEV